MPPMFTIQAATINAAQLLKHDKDLGTVAEGKIADVVAVPGNPDRRHQLDEAGELRDEGRGGLQAERRAARAARAWPAREPKRSKLLHAIKGVYKSGASLDENSFPREEG